MLIWVVSDTRCRRAGPARVVQLWAAYPGHPWSMCSRNFLGDEQPEAVMVIPINIPHG